MIFMNKQGKSSSNKLKDKRRLSLLNMDYKLCSGLEASRLKKTIGHSISRLQYVGGKDRRITHAVNIARDAINIASQNHQEKAAILDTDFMQAFDYMLVPWCLLVLKRKGLPDITIKRFFNLYKKNIS